MSSPNKKLKTASSAAEEAESYPPSTKNSPSPSSSSKKRNSLSPPPKKKFRSSPAPKSVEQASPAVEAPEHANTDAPGVENGRHFSKRKTSQSAPKPKACDACRKRKIRCKHRSADPTATTPPTPKPEAEEANAIFNGSPVNVPVTKIADATAEGTSDFLPAAEKSWNVNGARESSVIEQPVKSHSDVSVANATDTAIKAITESVPSADKTINTNGNRESPIKQLAKDIGNGSSSSQKSDRFQSDVTDTSIWQGWCEIESEPANFNVMLKEYGVKRVRVKEVWSLDGLDDLPQPVYGTILLFRYRDVGIEDETQPCPDNLWFANQTAQNACATTALLNMMLNAPGVDLGEPLTQFKEFTKDFTPFLRGQEIANFQFVKTIHNSFAKKADKLNEDLCMKNDYDARNKKTKKRKALQMEADEDTPYHFVAFVPVEGSVWRLDGLDAEPSNIGAVPEIGWLSLAGERIGAIMAAGLDGGSDIGYTLLAVVHDPVEDLRQALTTNMASMKEVEGREGAEGQRSALEAEGVRLQGRIQEEEWEVEEEEARVKASRHDYVPIVRAWVRLLAEKGVLKKLLEGKS